MTLYVITCWSLCTLTSALILILLVWQRFLLVKPSVVVIIFFHFCIQWAATIDASQIELFLPSPWAFACLTNVFPLAVLSLAVLLLRRSSRQVWRRLVEPIDRAPKRQNIACYILGVVVITISAYYLSQVPFRETGLYAILFDPASSTVARERSLKSLDSGFLRYAYSFTISSFAPLLAALLWTRWIYCSRKARFWKLLQVLPMIAIILVATSLSGARSFAVTVLVCLGFVWAFARGFPLNPLYAIGGLFVSLISPVLISIYREGEVYSTEKFFEYFFGPIFGRVFHMPMETGLFYTHYAQTNGFLGVGAIERLATVMGIEYFNAPHELGVLYYPQWASEALNMNTCYLYAYYCYFGIISLPFCILGLWLIDLIALSVYRKLSNRLLLASCATVSVSCLSLISVEYTIALVSNGIAVTLIGALLVDQFCQINFSHDRNCYARLSPYFRTSFLRHTDIS